MRKETLVKWTALLLVVLITSCKSHDSTQDGEENTVIVQLHDNNAIAELENDFSEYNLKNKKVLSRPMQIFLFTFNSKKIESADLVELLKESNFVKDAQLNRNVTQRN
ncbi:MAG: hypothetical protein Aureis2KO_09760 [Aureisphaera sp.]